MKEKLAVPTHHQTALRILLAERAAAQARVKADLEARQGAIREYLIQILAEAELDDKVYGLDQSLTKFVLLPPPPSNPQPVETVPSPLVAKDLAEVKVRSGRDNMKVPE